MTDANMNADRLNPLFHPAAHYASPDDVLNDAELSTPEKRIILSSWASDMFAVESCPALREIPGMGHAIRLADILAALRQLDDGDDDPPPRGGVPMRLRRPWAAELQRHRRSPIGAATAPEPSHPRGGEEPMI
ncbi:hypothetical protein CI1B_44080 [Bradyrhizobium ivorense]|uniref:Uncharacterized protein n=1 Tax=Bradyrhizobium ivorense TaxID=2511166 RepID=A0A508TEA8_9BRAD|nr:hypothetical protein [Bradyrhizobium ivorense]VIO67255.1 hypothetical protein CI41S_06180 [Bradyrhizobium ivorense]VIO72761.1 hypothetical protein CI1B_44080 [Bradyrhizobium ivorense]